MQVNFCANGVIQKSFTIGEIVTLSPRMEKSDEGFKQFAKVIMMAGGTLGLILPKAVLAAGVNSTFGNMHVAIMNAFDAGIVLVIIFAGASWALGYRTKAIEILIGVCCGYLLARHAIDIRDFLKSI